MPRPVVPARASAHIPNRQLGFLLLLLYGMQPAQGRRVRPRIFCALLYTSQAALLPATSTHALRSLKALAAGKLRPSPGFEKEIRNYERA